MSVQAATQRKAGALCSGLQRRDCSMEVLPTNLSDQSSDQFVRLQQLGSHAPPRQVPHHVVCNL